MNSFVRCALLVCLVLIAGCRGYGEVSEKAYEYAQALYSICNRQDKGRLEGLAELVQASVDESEVSSQEAAWLGAIIDEAREGEWKSASKRARRLMEDQVDGR